MDYKEIFKKYWFVAVIAVLLIVFVGIYAVDAYNNRELTVASKDVDGKSVVYSVDGSYKYADEFYDSIYAKNGLNCEYIAFQRAVLDSAYETTDEINQVATSYAAYMYQYYDPAQLSAELQAMGYVNGTDDLVQYYVDAQKRDLLIKDYCKANVADTIDKFKAENDPRIIYHILVMVEDIETITDDDGNVTYKANPTQDETNKLNQVLEELKTKSFQEVATELSDDGSATNGGLIGCISKVNEGNYYPVFSAKALELANDEVSEPVLSQAGYHIIWNAGNSTDLLLADNEFVVEIEQFDPTIGAKAVMDQANKLGFEIVDENLSKMINAQLTESEVTE